MDSSHYSLSESVWWKRSTSTLALEPKKNGPGYSTEFPGVIITQNDERVNVSDERIQACVEIEQARALRAKYFSFERRDPDWVLPSEDEIWNGPLPEKSTFTFSQSNGVYQAFDADGKALLPGVCDVMTFYTDYTRLNEIISSGPVKTYTYSRCRLLHHNFKMHKLLNSRREQAASEDDPRDFSNIVKVDTHIHLAAAMTARHLLDFIKEKAKTDGDRKVFLNREKKELTLNELFKEAGLNPQNFTLNMLDVHADTTFQRFDIFNAKYNPFGKSELREVFLKTSNYIKGDYYAQITTQLFKKLEKSKYRMAEYRISIYGKSIDEWDDLAKWITHHKLFSPHQRWMIQIPRIFFVYRRMNACQSFQNLIDNIFKPLFEATVDPSSHPEVHRFLQQVSGFDSVDDESRPEGDFNLATAETTPEKWTSTENPPYAYYMYYTWVNVATLNALRRARGMRTFDIRPHCGESGALNHLSSAFLLANGINHGIQLSNSTPLQYLYYLEQIGCAVSPLSNNSLFIDYKSNPFKKLFSRGLNVSLSTDDPLQFHFTETPLIEEYAIAAQRFHFTQCDLSEIAANSIRQSGFEKNKKKKWLGPQYGLPGVQGNDISYSNIPAIRAALRENIFNKENESLKLWAATKKSGRHEDDLQTDAGSLSSYARLTIDTPSRRLDLGENNISSIGKFLQVFWIRDRYQELNVRKPSSQHTKYVFKYVHGIHLPFSSIHQDGEMFIGTRPLIQTPTFAQFFQDYSTVQALAKNRILISEAEHRLNQGKQLFNCHLLLNGDLEKKALQNCSIDVHHIHTVDNGISLLCAMTSKQLLHFIKRKVSKAGDTVVQTNPRRTLKEVYDDLGVPLENFTLDSLNTVKSETLGASLKDIFLGWNNSIDGSFFGELIHLVMQKKFTHNQYHLHELHCQISGGDRKELEQFAKWVKKNNLFHPQICWVLEFSTASYPTLRSSGKVQNFGEMLSNIFTPLFEANNDPESHPELVLFLQHLRTFSLAVPDRILNNKDLVYILPHEYDTPENPSYEYYMYYIWGNLRSLNAVRKIKGHSTFTFRPTTGLTGERDRLISAYLLAHSVSGGVDLRKSSVMEYAFFIQKIPVVMSPLFDNATINPYEKCPLFRYFSRGITVSLATRNPLQLHATSQALMEELAIASQMWKLSSVDIAELALNSVIICGFPDARKTELVGDVWDKGADFNDPDKTNIPSIRLKFRDEWHTFNKKFFHQAFVAYQDQIVRLEPSLPSFPQFLNF